MPREYLPLILVGLKNDLITDKRSKTNNLSMRAAKFAMDKQIQYHEVSSKLNENVS